MEFLLRRRRSPGTSRSLTGGGSAASQSGYFDAATGTGWTDFSEFALQVPGVAPPLGLTVAYGGGAPQYEVALDPTEGNYLGIRATDYGNQAWTLDAFTGIGAGNAIEILARMWFPLATANRRLLGPAFQINGAAKDFCLGGVYYGSGSDFESTVIVVNADAGGVALDIDLQEAEQTGVWGWVRFRGIGQRPVHNDAYYIKSWYGGLVDEPVAWDQENSNSIAQMPQDHDAIGFAMVALANIEQQQRCAYLSFTLDPTTTPPPVPAGG